MTTSPRYKSTVACQCNGGLDCPNPVLVGVKKASDSTRLFLDTHLALTEAATRGAKIINNNPVWFTEPPEPVSMIHIPLITNPLFENKGRASELFDIFFTNVNPYFPALERTSWINEHINVLDAPSLPPTKRNCMVLLVAALGAIAQDKRIGAPQSADAHNCMITAQVMLPDVVLGIDITAVQCMILFSLYYLWVINPSQSYNCMSMASTKLQFILFAYLFF
jgi:hypothetical protein